MTRDTIICMAALFCIGWITGMVRLLILHLNFGALAARMFAQVIDCAADILDQGKIVIFRFISGLSGSFGAKPMLGRMRGRDA